MRPSGRETVVTGVVWLLAILVVGASVLHGVASLSPSQPAGSAVSSDAAEATSSDWAQLRHTVEGTGYTSGAGIDATNVARLSEAWSYQSTKPFSSTPAIVGNVVYTTTGKSLYAFDLRTGAALWHYDDTPNPYGSLLTSAVAVDPTTHIAYYGTPDARVYAVNTQTHQGVWNVQLADPAHGAFIWDSPLLANGLLYIGTSSLEDTPCIRSAAYALDPATGAIRWTHYTTPAGTLGGGIWSSIAADPAARALLVTTGNPCPAGHSIAEDDSILALDWTTGKTLWQFTAISRDHCDCDFGEGATSFTYQGQSYVVAGSKYGVVYAVAPPSAPGQAPRLLWSLRLTGAGYLNGAGIYQPPTYHDGLLFVAGGPTTDGACAKGALWAVDVETGVPRWRHCTADQVVGPSALSGDVLFLADTSAITAFAAQTGAVLWRAAITGPVWGGVAVAHDTVLVGTVPGVLHAYTVPQG
jgi:outer membrane protein assembly factor BamB